MMRLEKLLPGGRCGGANGPGSQGGARRCTQTLDTRLTEAGSLHDGQGLGLPRLESVESWWRQGL